MLPAGWRRRPRTVRGLLWHWVLPNLKGAPRAMAATISPTRVRPARDEWGVYDPEQAGLAALYARLDDKDSKPATTGKPDVSKDAPVRPTPRPA